MLQEMPKHAVKAAFEQDVESDAEIAVDNELSQLQRPPSFSAITPYCEMKLKLAVNSRNRL